MDTHKPFPTNKADKVQLWEKAQLLIPGLTGLVTTLKDQNITFKVVRLDTGEEVYADAPDPDPSQLWQVDDALVERVRLKEAKEDWQRVEAKRKETKRIEAAKRKRK